MIRQTRSSTPVLRTAPVLAVLVCHDGEAWLPEALAALRASAPRPRHVLAVDTGSLDGTPVLLGEAEIVDGVLTRDRRTGFAAAVDDAVAAAAERWGDQHDGWIWVLHDDCAPDPDCLGTLLTAADASPSAAVLGPLALDWHDPRLVVEAGLSTDASGHRQTGIGPSELDWSRLGRGNGFGQSTEVLAVPSAGMLVRRELWVRLGGFDREIPLLREDIDFGWRANRAGAVVLCVPAARMRHVRALPAKLRGAEARGPAVLAARGPAPGAEARGAARSVAAGKPGATAPGSAGNGSGPAAAGASAPTAPGSAGRAPRPAGAASGPAARRGPGLRSVRALDRAQGLRTFLVNCPPLSFALGVPRLTVLCLIRALGFAMQRRLDDCRAEVRALGYLLGGGAGLRRARASRRPAIEVRGVRGLFTSRLTRLRNGLRAGVALLVRRRLQADAALGRLPDTADLLPAGEEPARRPVGPEALPAGVAGRVRRPAGLRRPATAVAVSLTLPDTELPAGLRPSPRPRPSPVPRDGSGEPAPDLVIVQVDRARLARQVLVSPPVVLVVTLLGLGLWLNSARLGTDLAGGRLLRVPDLATTWSSYLATWHPVAGGTAAPAPAALAVLGGLGALLAPVGGVPAVVATLLLGDLPLAGLAAYVATRGMPVDRWVRALVAAAYALLPTATAAVSQGRLDVVVAHILLPLVTAGVIALLGGARTDTRWLSIAAASAFGLAVLGAFAPLVHVLLVVYALAGFVLVPGRRGDGRRRVTALFVLVLMPLALLLPWPAVLIQHPGVVLQGVGAQVGPVDVTLAELVSLDPGGPGAWPFVGLLVGLAAVAGLVVRPRRAVLPGFALALLGGLAVWLVLAVPAAPLTGGPARTGWAGAGLLVTGWGLLLAVLGTCRAGRSGRAAPRAVRVRRRRADRGGARGARRRRPRRGCGDRRPGGTAGRRARAAAGELAGPRARGHRPLGAGAAARRPARPDGRRPDAPARRRRPRAGRRRCQPGPLRAEPRARGRRGRPGRVRAGGGDGADHDRRGRGGRGAVRGGAVRGGGGAAGGCGRRPRRARAADRRRPPGAAAAARGRSGHAAVPGAGPPRDHREPAADGARRAGHRAGRGGPARGRGPGVRRAGRAAAGDRRRGGARLAGDGGGPAGAGGACVGTPGGRLGAGPRGGGPRRAADRAARRPAARAGRDGPVRPAHRHPRPPPPLTSRVPRSGPVSPPFATAAAPRASTGVRDSRDRSGGLARPEWGTRGVRRRLR